MTELVLDYSDSFETAKVKFLMMSEEDREAAIELLELFLDAATYADFLFDNATEH